MSAKLCTYEEWSKTLHNPNFPQIFLTITIFVLLDFIIVVGNSMVIIYVVMDKKLRSTIKTLILSLALADLMIGIVIVPFSATNNVMKGYWIFGDFWCITNIAWDIWLCTTSIYNIVAMSIDRLIAITKPLHHSVLVTDNRIYLVVAAIWMGSFLLCSPSLLLTNTYKSMSDQCRCIPMYADRIYIIISATLCFYVPMMLVAFISTKIYIITRRASLPDVLSSLDMDESKKKECYSQYKVFRGNVQIKIGKIGNKKTETAQSKAKGNIIQKCHRASDIDDARELLKSQFYCLKHAMSEPANLKSEMNTKSIQREYSSEQSDIRIVKNEHQHSLLQISSTPSKIKFYATLDNKSQLQIKTAKITTIISGCVIFCRLFYSILYGFSLNVSPYAWSTSFCMGYVNSALNPIIYFLINRNLKNSFKELFTFSTNFRTSNIEN